MAAGVEVFVVEGVPQSIPPPSLDEVLTADVEEEVPQSKSPPEEVLLLDPQPPLPDEGRSYGFLS